MKITKKELEKLYNTMHNKALCAKLGITEPTLIKLIKKAGIKNKGSGSHKRHSKVEVLT